MRCYADKNTTLGPDGVQDEYIQVLDKTYIQTIDRNSIKSIQVCIAP